MKPSNPIRTLKPSIGPSRSGGPRILGTIGALTVLSMVASDFVRRYAPGQSIVITMAPLLVAIVGSVLALDFRGRPPIPKSGRLAILALLILCFFSTLVGFSRGLPRAQLLAGWIAEAGALPGLVLGYAMCFEDRGWKIFRRTLIFLVAGTIVLALFQQFGFFQTQVFEMIEGAQVERGLQTGSTFRYTTGPFRTANVFAIFLAVSGLIVVVSESADSKKRQQNTVSTKTIVILVLLVACSVMAARRSGLVMLLGSIVPFLYVAGGRLKVAAMAIAGAGIVFFAGFGHDAPLESDLTEKVQFATSELNVSGRLGEAFSVNDHDWRLVSASGDGIGSHGPATQAAGAAAFRRENQLLLRHPILHVGWFKDLVAFGYFGFFAHFAWFLFLVLAVVRVQSRRGSRKLAARYSGIGFLGVAVINYYFVATSWLQSVTGGLLFGLGIGIFLARMRIDGAREEAAATPTQSGK